jgi:hypothetical protein
LYCNAHPQKEINMCMFCAAIPATAAVAAKLNADQQGKIREAQESGAEPQPKPIKTIAAGVIVLLLVGSVVYHTHFNSLI